tara:strand:- start:5312 stop:7528 length:2217 start_codon:yes stop_codon:yes gene_type:complete
MTATYDDGTGNGSNKNFNYTFPILQTEDVKVALNRVVQATTKYTVNTSANPTRIEFNNTSIDSSVQETTGAPKTGVSVRVYRETTVGKTSGDDDPKAVFAAGSSIRAVDLNANAEQALYAIHELQDQPFLKHDIEDGSITSSKIEDGTIVNDDISGTAAIAQSKIATGTLPSGVQINSSNIVDGSIVNADINSSAAIAGTKISPNFGSQVVQTTGNIVVGGTVDGRDIAADGTKLDTVETNAKDDQTATEIKTLYEGNSNTNAYTDAEKTKLTNIETAATADQTGAEIKTLYEANADTNEFSDAEQSKLAAIEPSATADQTAGEIKTLLQSDKLTLSEMNTTSLDSRYYTETEADAAFLRQDSSETIASGVTWSSVDSKVATTAAIDARIIDLVDDVGGFVPLANETSFPTANPDVNDGAGTLVSIKAIGTTRTPSGGSVTIANGAGTGNTVTITGCGSTVLTAGFGVIVETTTTTHTYAFHRLVPKATEVTTVAANATNIAAAGANVSSIDNFANRYQVNASAPTARPGSGSLANGDLWFDNSSNKVMMVYDGSAGDGYSPITPNQATLTNINIVAGQITYQEDLGNITDAVNTGSGNNSVNTVGSNIANVNTVAGISSNVTAVAGNNANVTTVAGSISNVNTVGGAIANVNRYADEYVIQSGAPSSPSAGDLWYSTTANILNFYNGTSWTGISPGIAGVINDANPALANHLDCNDKNLTEVGTVSGDNLQIDFGTL